MKYRIFACKVVIIDGKRVQKGKSVEYSTNEQYIAKRCEELQDKGKSVAWELCE